MVKQSLSLHDLSKMMLSGESNWGKYSILSAILTWENGELAAEQELDFFKHLVQTGVIHNLKSAYRKKAKELGLL